MTTNYPSSLDTTTELPNDRVNSTLNTLVHAAHHNNISDAIMAIQAELGLEPKGDYSDVKARVANLAVFNPSADQIFRATDEVPTLTVRASAAQFNAFLISLQTAGGSTLASWNRLGAINAVNYHIDGINLAVADLDDVTDLILNPSPSITTPTIAGATITGTPTAPTVADTDNSTKIATTAYVKDQLYALLAGQAFTGTTQAPTQTVGNNSTRIATTEFVLAEIDNLVGGSAPIGSVSGFAAGSAPSASWLLCDGSAISRTTYSELFDLLNAASLPYGSGNGSTTFNIPDLRGRSIVGKGTHVDVDALGDSDGIAVATRRPTHAHTHGLSVGGGDHSHGFSSSSSGSHSHSASGTSGGGSVASGSDIFCTFSGSVETSGGGDHSHSFSVDAAGSHGHSISSATIGSAGMSEKAAYTTINYMIKVL